MYTGGYVDVDEMARIVITRLEEHFQSVRNLALGTITTVLPLDQWQNRSNPLFCEMQVDAKAACRAHKSIRRGAKGETTIGAGCNATHGIDEDGKRTSYKRGIGNTMHRRGQDRPRKNDQRQAPSPHEQAAPARYGKSYTHEKKSKRAEEEVCIKCNRKGHRVPDCRDSQRWQIMAAWPPSLQEHAPGSSDSGTTSNRHGSAMSMHTDPWAHQRAGIGTTRIDERS